MERKYESMIQVKLKDGTVKEFAEGTTVAEVTKSLGAGLLKAACAGKYSSENGCRFDLH